MDDQLAALRRGDPAALAVIYEQHAQKIYRLAISVLHDEQQADGVVQNTFVALIRHVNQFEGRASLGTWLYRVAYNECLGRLRQAQRLDDRDITEADEGDTVPACFVSWDASPEALLANQEAAEQLNRAINALSAPLRAVFTLRDVEGVSTQETAQILGISTSAVKVRLHRARLALRETLAAYFQEGKLHETDV